MTWAPDYVTLPVLKDYLNIDVDDIDDDVFLAQWITTTSHNVNDFCGRQFGKVAAPEQRFYEPSWDCNEYRWYVNIDDLQDTVGLVVEDDDGNTVTDHVLLPRNAAAKGRPYERLRLAGRTGEIAATASWGWNTVPAAAPTGLLLQAARLNKRRSAPFGVAGSPANGGTELRLLAQLDPDFKTSLRPFQRKWWAA